MQEGNLPSDHHNSTESQCAIVKNTLLTILFCLPIYCCALHNHEILCGDRMKNKLPQLCGSRNEKEKNHDILCAIHQLSLTFFFFIWWCSVCTVNLVICTNFRKITCLLNPHLVIHSEKSTLSLKQVSRAYYNRKIGAEFVKRFFIAY